MYRITATVLSVALLGTAALAAPLGRDRAQLVAMAREAAGWTGVEAERLRIAGDTLVVYGHDRQGRTVSLTIDRTSGDTLERVVHHNNEQERLATNASPVGTGDAAH